LKKKKKNVSISKGSTRQNDNKGERIYISYFRGNPFKKGESAVLKSEGEKEPDLFKTAEVSLKKKGKKGVGGVPRKKRKIRRKEKEKERGRPGSPKKLAGVWGTPNPPPTHTPNSAASEEGGGDLPKEEKKKARSRKNGKIKTRKIEGQDVP